MVTTSFSEISTIISPVPFEITQGNERLVAPQYSPFDVIPVDAAVQSEVVRETTHANWNISLSGTETRSVWTIVIALSVYQFDDTRTMKQQLICGVECSNQKGTNDLSVNDDFELIKTEVMEIIPDGS
jgi:hypothetical protein